MSDEGGPSSTLLARLRESPTLERLVRRLDALAHYRLQSLGRTGRLDRFTDEVSTHRGSNAPPWPYSDTSSPLVSQPGPDGFVNPVLTAADVTDYGDVNYVADPFLMLWPERWDLYFEVYNPDRDPTAVVGRATSTDSGRSWTYNGVVLNPGVHVSFPYVFRYDGTTYMTPNINPDTDHKSVILYRADGENKNFERAAHLADPDGRPTDRVVFFDGDRWWLFVAVAAAGVELHLYHSDSLTRASWTPHAGNPVTVDEPRIPGGRPVVTADRLVTFVQDGPGYYGECVRAVEVTELSPTVYEDRLLAPNPVVGPADGTLGWNTRRMHTFDPWYTGDRWVCAVDGDTAFGSSLVGPHWAIGLLSVPI